MQRESFAFLFFSLILMHSLGKKNRFSINKYNRVVLNMCYELQIPVSTRGFVRLTYNVANLLGH